LSVLIYETGPNKGRTIRLEEDAVYVIGRDPNAAIPVDDELASRQHARVRGKDGKFYLKDSGSSNGTLVNDERVDLAELQSGDKVSVGTTILSFLSDAEAGGGGGGGRTLGGYRLLQRLGRGGMGTVFRSLQLSLNREVALKILSPELSQDPAFRDRFLKEARAAGQLNHPNVVQVYDVDQDEGLIFYAMEYVPGGTVEDRLNKEQMLTVDDALRMLLDAAKGLQYAELKKIVHRDIKPDNLMMTDMGSVKIADLGLALGTHEGEGKSKSILGTPHFISPEQARSEPLDTRSDLYSLGATFFRVLTGKTMYHGENAKEIIRKQVKEPPPSLRGERAEVPEKVAAIYNRLVQKDPADRFQSPTELIDAIDAVSAGGGAKKTVTIAVLVVIVAVLGVMALLKEDPAEPVTIVKTDNGKSEALTAELEAKEAEVLAQQRETAAMTARVELDEREDTLGRQAYVAALSALAAEYVGTSAAQKATAKASELQTVIDGERRAAAEHVAAIEAAIAGMETAVDAALKTNGFAVAQAAVVAAGGGTDAVKAEASVTGAQQRLLDKIEAAAKTAIGLTLASAEASIGEHRFDDAATDVASAEGMIGDPVALVDGALKTTLAGLAEKSAALKGQIESSRNAFRAAQLAQDLTAIGSFDWPAAFESISGHDFAPVQSSLETLRGSLVTADYDAWLDRRIQDLATAAALRAGLEVAITGGSLANEEVQHPERNMSATLSGIAPDGDGVLVQVKRGAGTSTSAVPYADFADVGGFLDLHDERLGSDPVERMKVARAAMVFALGPLHRQVSRVAAQLAAYDPAAGWSGEQRAAIADVALPAPPTDRLTALFAAIESDAALAADVAALKLRAEREIKAQLLFTQAIQPFQRSEGAIPFAHAVALFEELIAEYHDTDFFLVTFGMFDRGDGSVPLAE